jgi:hypothetical protein
VAWGLNNYGLLEVPSPNTEFVAVAAGAYHALGLKSGGTPCPGDLNADSAVSLQDLTILLAHFGTPSGATYADGDLNADGDVDLSDLTLLLAHFGTTCP